MKRVNIFILKELDVLDDWWYEIGREKRRLMKPTLTEFLNVDITEEQAKRWKVDSMEDEDCFPLSLEKI